MPEKARSKVDLPLPEGPLINTLSPAAMLAFKRCRISLPLGKTTCKLVVCSDEPGSISSSDFSFSICRKLASKPIKRSVVARQVAMLA